MHVQLNTSTTNADLQVAAIQQIALLNGVTGLTAPVLNTLNAAVVNNPITVGLLNTALGFTGLYPLQAGVGAVATCTTPYIPVGNYTSLNVGLTSAPRPHCRFTLSWSPPLSTSTLETCCIPQHGKYH